MTNVYISIDMEGVAGIATLNQVWRGSDDYPASRLLMTKEANAAVAGAFDGGATRVVVNDSHGDMANLLPEEMDPRAELLIGTPKAWSMMQGFGADFDVALFIAYHARAGTEAAVLDHTYSGRLLYEVRVNGEPWAEADLNAALATTYGVPVGLVTGDDKCCAQALERLKWIRTVEVKQAHGRGSASSMHPSEARRRISEGASEAVRAATSGKLELFRPEAPFTLEADVANTSATELCALVPGVERIGSRTVRFDTDDFRTLYRCLLTWTHVGASEAPRYPGP
jgi:D-amino peptidase